MALKLLLLLFLFSGLHARSRKVEEDEYEDSSSNQKWVLAPKSQDRDVTLILNKLLREYDKKLRPDIGLKPTVIDVDIYVNSIGPVSSINMKADPPPGENYHLQARRPQTGRNQKTGDARHATMMPAIQELSTDHENRELITHPAAPSLTLPLRTFP
ncbi:gamma-aminobutyric acid receptor subunit gamma-3-like isoform X1 [Vicugna pacos]|uniref:Gamma-aminobutyric acid receptor subunit gamma-3-like isoform X1 n=1 Tax=Vicugna pacos TaxID=30538 RepID=A0ABM5CF54_VICPA